MKITKEETKAMLDNKVSDCGYDMNSIFHGYDILYFKGSGERSRSNAVGVNINEANNLLWIINIFKKEIRQ